MIGSTRLEGRRNKEIRQEGEGQRREVNEWTGVGVYWGGG